MQITKSSGDPKPPMTYLVPPRRSGPLRHPPVSLPEPGDRAVSPFPLLRKKIALAPSLSANPTCRAPKQATRCILPVPGGVRGKEQGLHRRKARQVWRGG